MDIKTVAMIGSGVMGTGIAQVLAAGGYDVHLYDVREEALTSALERIEHGKYGLRRGVALGKVTEAQLDAALEHLATFTDLAAACAGVDLVIEAVPEDLGLKVRLFRQLDALPKARDPRLQYVRLPDHGAGTRHRSARSSDRLALRLAGTGDAVGGDCGASRNER